MKTNNWREDIENLFDELKANINLDEGETETSKTVEEIKDFIQSLLDEKDKEKEEALDKQREEIILAISDSYINSIHTSNNEGARLWRNEIINKLINKIKEI